MRHAPDSHAHSQKGNPQPDSYDRRKPLGSYLLASGPAAHRPMDEELNKLSAAGDEKAILALVQAVRNAALHYREDGVAAEDPHSSEQTARSAGEQEQQKSRWVPWELGVGWEGIPKIALFPSAGRPNRHDMASREYLGR